MGQRYRTRNLPPLPPGSKEDPKLRAWLQREFYGVERSLSTVAPDQMVVPQLSAIVADIGIITAGQLHNAANDAGILLTGSLPGGWTRYLDLVSAHATFLKHDKLTLNYDGTATFNGTLRSLVGKSTTTAPAVQMLYSNFNLASDLSSTEISLATFSLPASALGTNGDAIRVTIFFRTIGVPPNAVKVKFGATVVGTAVNADNQGVLTVIIQRTGAATQNAAAVVIGAGGTGVTLTTPAETLSGAVTLDFRATGGGGGFTSKMDSVLVEYLGA